MRLLLLILALLLPTASLAQVELPGLFTVTGVASDDVLNIRAGPGAGHDIIGAFAPGTTGVEVVGTDPAGGWYLVNTGEQSGWSSASFLTRTGPDWAAGLPQNLQCAGTEPFWSLTQTGTTAQFATPDGNASYTHTWSGPPMGFQPFEFSSVYDGPLLSMATATIRREACGDGMSDRTFGLSILLTRINGTNIGVYSGCCSLTP